MAEEHTIALIEGAIQQLTKQNDNRPGVLAKDIARYLRLDKSIINRTLYNNSDDFRLLDKDVLPRKWVCVPKLNSEMPVEVAEKNDDLIKLLILIDLGNVHDCFHALKEPQAGTKIIAGADPAFNIDALAKLCPIPCKPSTDAPFAALYKLHDGRIIMQSKLSNPSFADLLLVDYFYSALKCRKIRRDVTKLIIASKDNIFSAFAKISEQYVKEVCVVRNANELDAEL